MKIKHQHGNTLTVVGKKEQKSQRRSRRTNGRAKAYFMQLLEGTETPGYINGEINETTETEENEDEVTGEEIQRQIAKLKTKKAPGEDGLENEVWINGNRKVIQRLKEIINRVWKGEGLPDRWKEGVIAPIFKKGDKENFKNYRGITLLNSAYKIYAMILEDRLKAELEDKHIIPETQAGFRRGRSTIDNIFILNYITNRELVNKGGKIYAFFADLSAAFDKVDREELHKVMERTGISQKIRKRIDEIYRETRNVVRVNGHTSSRFWTTKGVRQGCPLSPTLFTLYTVDLEERMRKGLAGGIVIGREKIWTLAYADDLVLLARSPEELKEKISRFRKYLEKKKLTLNAEKSKVMIFKKGRGRKKMEEWRWNEERLEEVK